MSKLSFGIKVKVKIICARNNLLMNELKPENCRKA